MTKVTNLTEGVEESIPTAIASIDDVVYGFDEENNFFSLDTETFKRTVIADAGTVMTHVTLLPDQGVTEFVVRDLAYDKANDRLVALGTRYGINDYGQVQEFTKRLRHLQRGSGNRRSEASVHLRPTQLRQCPDCRR